MAKRRTILTTIALALGATAARAQDDNASSTANADGDHMVVTRAGERPGQIAGGENFTGTVYVEPVFDARDPFAVNAGKVTFLPGARSNWHSHPAGQMLIVTDGIGWVSERDGKRIEMRAGDVIWTPPGVEHWHGATSDSAVSHYAVQQYRDGENVIWLEPVSDADYLEP